MSDQTNSVKSTITKVFLIAVCIIMYIQIVSGILWIVANIGNVPPFGDSDEYLELSRTFAPDEYRPILFPIILRMVQNAAAVINIPYQTLLYIIQLIVSFCAIYCAVRYISRSAGYNPGILVKLYITTYVWSLPMILWFNCTVLTDSLSLSALIWMLIGLSKYVKDGKSDPLLWAGIIVMYLLQALMRSDRTYSALVMIILCIAIRTVHDLIKGKGNQDGNEKSGKRLLVTLMPVLLVVFGLIMVISVNHATQKPGSKGRVSTNLAFVLLDRVVWPNMERNYEYFPDEIKEVISIEEAQVFDSHNNNVMYQMAPLVEERVGKEKASEYYMTMAGIVWAHDGVKVIKDTAGCVLAFLMLPQAEYMNRHKMLEMNTGWNIHCMSHVDEALAKFMFNYYMYTFIVIFCTMSIIYLVVSRKYRKSVGRLSCFAGMSVLLALWFGLGDGAPVNDRYALIVLVTWGMMWMLVLLRILPRRKGKGLI